MAIERLEALRPDDIHPSHDVRDEGFLHTDPICQRCRRDAYNSADHTALREPCAPIPCTARQERALPEIDLEEEER